MAYQTMMKQNDKLKVLVDRLNQYSVSSLNNPIIRHDCERARFATNQKQVLLYLSDITD